MTTRRRRTARTAQITAVAVLLTLLVGLTGIRAEGAAAAGNGTVTGTVTQNGAPLAGAGVWIYRADAQTRIGLTTTSATGTWTLSLPPGTYRIMTWPSNVGLPATWYPSGPVWADASNVAVAEGTTIVVDHAVDAPGTVSGTVTLDGVPTGGLVVNAYWANTKVRTTTTAADGTYTLTGLVSGSYAIGAFDLSGGHAARFWPDQPSALYGTRLPVDGDVTTDIDLILPLTGEIQGRVTTTGDVPVAGVGVLAVGYYGGIVGRGATAADGSYRVGGLKGGTYRVQMWDATFTWIGMFAPEAPDFEGGATYQVEAGAVTAGVDIRTHQVATAPLPPYTGNPAAPTVAVLGDSVTQLTTTALHTVLDPTWSVSVRGVGGMRTDEMMATATAYAATEPDQVVINLGTNDAGQGVSAATYQATLETMIDLFPSTGCVHLVTISTSSGLPNTTAGGQSYNDVLRALPRSRPQVRVIDWSDALATHLTDDQNDPMWSFDLVHPAGAGKAALAGLVADSLATCAVPDGEVTGIVHADEDASGTFDPGEEPRPGALVRAWRDTDDDGTFESVARTVTSETDGRYRLADLAPDDYRIALDPDQVAPATPGTTGVDVTIGPNASVAVDLGVVPVVEDLARTATTFGGPGSDAVRDLVVLPSGDMAVLGRFSDTMTIGTGPTATTLTSAGGVDGFVALLDPAGEPHWAHRLGSAGDEDVFGLDVGPDGSVAVTGVVTINGSIGEGAAEVPVPGNWDALLIVFEADGSLRWSRTTSGQNLSVGTSVTFLPSGRLAVGTLFVDRVNFGGTATLDSRGFVDSAVTIHDAATGALEHVTHIGGPGVDIVAGLAPLPDGRVVISGMGSGPVRLTGGGATLDVTGVGSLDMLLATVDPASGAPTAARLVGSSGGDRALRVATDPTTGAIYVAGDLSGPATIDGTTVPASHDAVVLALDDDLSLRWARWSQGGSAMFADIAVLGSSVQVVGSFSGRLEFASWWRHAAHGDDGVLIELGTDGTPVAIEVLAGPEGHDALVGVDHDGAGGVVVAGMFVTRATMGSGATGIDLDAVGTEDAAIIGVRPAGP